MRPYRKEKQKSGNKQIKRASSMAVFKTYKYTHNKTLAELNQVSIKQKDQHFHVLKPLRINLPEYFNIPRFIDQKLNFNGKQTISQSEEAAKLLKSDFSLKKKMKDLTLLAEGMKRAKNIKEESRCYYIQGVLMHNSKNFESSIVFFDKFLKIVLFIKDQKSVQLALNAIGIDFMYLNNPKRAIQFHSKQKQIKDGSEQFMGFVNSGLCYELMNKPQQAYEEYMGARAVIYMKNQNERQEHLNKLIQRVESKMAKENNSPFMTQEFQEAKLNSKGLSNSSSIKSNSKELYEKMLKKQTLRNGKQWDNAKINYAIFQADQSFQAMKSSLRDSMHLD